MAEEKERSEAKFERGQKARIVISEFDNSWSNSELDKYNNRIGRITGCEWVGGQETGEDLPRNCYVYRVEVGNETLLVPEYLLYEE